MFLIEVSASKITNIVQQYYYNKMYNMSSNLLFIYILCLLLAIDNNKTIRIITINSITKNLKIYIQIIYTNKNLIATR